MADFNEGLCITKKSIKQSALDRNVSVRSKSRPSPKWKSSSETLESPTNSSDRISFSADDATSESEFDEHPYSMPKQVKTLNFNFCKQSVFQPKFETSIRPRPKSRKIRSEDNADSPFWQKPRPTSNVENEINKCSSKTRRRASKCESKNAVMARLNRLKKKKFIEDLENRNAKLESENELLKKALSKRLQEVSLLKRETVNLHSVIKNSTEIGSLLQCVQKNTNLHVTSSLLRNGSNSQQHLQSNKSLFDRTIGTSGPTIGVLTDNEEGMKHELNLSHCGNQSILNQTNPSCFSSESSVIDEICDFSFDIDPSDNDMLYDLKGEVNSNCFFNGSRPTSSKTESIVTDANELVRCETPSKDIDISVCNDDFLFNDVGVCFHIANNRVSLEFCESCNRKATIGND